MVCMDFVHRRGQRQQKHAITKNRLLGFAANIALSPLLRHDADEGSGKETGGRRFADDVPARIESIFDAAKHPASERRAERVLLWLAEPASSG